jgi:hypothetical protein
MGSSSPPGSKRSTTAGIGCAIAVFGLFFAGGLFFFVMMIFSFVLPEIRANTSFIQHTCKVLDKRIGEDHDSDGGSTYRAEMFIEYSVRGQQYRIWTYDATGMYSSGRSRKETILSQFSVGQEYPCWYDPDSPWKAVLVRGYSWLMYLFFLIPILFMVIGGGGMYHFWTRRNLSPEQLALRQAGGTSRGSLSLRGVEYPTVPDRDLSDNPGSTLRYRVPIGVAPAWKFVGYSALALFWNGIVSVFVVVVITSYMQGDPQKLLTCFLMPFVLIGLLLLGLAGKQLLITIGFSPAVVEIDAHPLCPGQTIPILITQTGQMQLHQITAMLVCEESVSYTEGTTTRHESKRVNYVMIAKGKDVTIRSGEPWEHRAELTVPANVMHTFASTNNKIEWKLIVEAKVANWPDFSWEYPLVVRPPTYAKEHLA